MSNKLFVICDNYLTPDEKKIFQEETKLSIKKKLPRAIVTFFYMGEKNFGKSITRFKKENKRAQEWKHLGIKK